MNTTKPFLNASQLAEWTCRNCSECEKAYDEEALRYHCDIEEALGLTSINDGSITKEIADRMGYDDPLVYCWECPEKSKGEV
jgi:hypothetical protein